MRMTNSSAIAAAAIMLSANTYSMPDVYLNPEPWAYRSQHKGSGTGKTGLNVPRSRAKAKAARKARKMHRSRAK